MFRKARKEPTTADAPDSIAPWEMLEEAETASWTAKVRDADPLRNLIVFARKADEGALACFDKGNDSTGKGIVVLQDITNPNGAKETRYSGFSAWFDQALRDHQNN